MRSEAAVIVVYGEALMDVLVAPDGSQRAVPGGEIGRAECRERV